MPNHSGAAFKAARVARGLRQEDIAAATGLSWRTVARWEDAANWDRIPYATVKAFASLVDLDPDTLVDGSLAA